MDNLLVRHAEPCVCLLKDAGMLVFFLFPNLNPMEEAVSYVKYFLQEHSDIVDTLDDPTQVLHSAFNSNHCN